MASWLAAVAALLALAVAGAGLFVVARMHQVLVRRFAVVEAWFEAYQLERWRAQAELVCAWPVSERETFEKIITRGVVGAAVRNASQTPVYAMELVYRDPDAAWTAVKRIRQVPPSHEPEVYAGFDEEETKGEPAPDRINEDGTIRLAPSADMHLELRFTDSQGRRWTRDEQGILSLSSEPSPEIAAGYSSSGRSSGSSAELSSE